MFFILAGFAVLLLVGLFVLDLVAHVCKKLRVIRNVPVTWSGREYRRSEPRARAPRVSASTPAPSTAAHDDLELVARAMTSPTLPFQDHQRMLELGFARYTGQWRKS